MSGFISFAEPMQQLITAVMAKPYLHAKWLNTLSYLENCGARKIAACEHPTLVKEEMLKHAAEEFRHAHHLKRQIERVYTETFSNYSKSFILGHAATGRYLQSLDVHTCRYLKGKQLSVPAIKEAAYLLVTFAIELRAEELYSIYDRLLRQQRSKVVVSSILLEEKGHLQEMREGIALLPALSADVICHFEAKLCKKWLDGIAKEISGYV